MSFAKDLKEFHIKARDRMDIILRKTAIDIHQGVVMMTPVDTGRARANWNVAVNKIDAQVTRSTTLSRVWVKALRAIEKIKPGDTIYISNNVDYIRYLEKGSSKQAPAGMVAVTVRRFPHVVEKATSEAKRERP